MIFSHSSAFKLVNKNIIFVYINMYIFTVNVSLVYLPGIMYIQRQKWMET